MRSCSSSWRIICRRNCRPPRLPSSSGWLPDEARQKEKKPPEGGFFIDAAGSVVLAEIHAAQRGVQGRRAGVGGGVGRVCFLARADRLQVAKNARVVLGIGQELLVGARCRAASGRRANHGYGAN